MGAISSYFQDKVSKYFVKKVRVAMIGLDAAGKTSIVYRLKLGTFIQTIPTTGFNCEVIPRGSIHLTMWDIGVGSRGRHLWKHYFENTRVLIFVVDSTDRDRINETQDELRWVMAENQLCDAIFLIFANKQDLHDAMTIDEIIEKLDLNSSKRNWYIQPCSAISGFGLEEGLQWISSQL